MNLTLNGRVAGVDLTRLLAFVGITVNHVYIDTWHARALWDWHAIGFALLIGVGLGYAVQPGEAGNSVTVRRAWVRGLVLVIAGLTLQATHAVSVVLVELGLVTAIVSTLAVLRTRVLLPVAATLLLAGPLGCFVVRAHGLAMVDEVGWPQLLRQPLATLTRVFFGGFYPAATWLPVALIGLLVVRLCSLTDRRQLTRLAGVGAAMAGGAFAASSAILAVTGSPQPYDLWTRANGHFPGFATDGRWLAGLAPYLPSTPSLVFSSGCVIVVLAAICLLCQGSIAELSPIRFLTAAGTMALSLYTLHVLVLYGIRAVSARSDLGLSLTGVFLVQLVACLFFVALWRAITRGPLRRGPLEWLSRAVAARVIPATR